MDPITNGVLAQIDKAQAFLASFTGTVPEVEEIRDRASAYVEFFRHCQTGLHAQNLAAELKIRCERKLGEMLPDPKPRGRPGKNLIPHDAELPMDSRDAGRLRQIAAVPEGELIAYFHDCREAGLEITSAGVRRLYASLNRQPKNGETVPTKIEPPPRLDVAPEKTPGEEILADLTRLTRKLTLWINSPDGAKFAPYLQACRLGGWLQARSIKVRLDDGTYKDLPIRFRGFNALRWFIRLAAKKGVKAPEKVAAEFKEAKDTSAGEWEGDTP